MSEGHVRILHTKEEVKEAKAAARAHWESIEDGIKPDSKKPTAAEKKRWWG